LAANSVTICKAACAVKDWFANLIVSQLKEITMRSILLFLLGVPIPIIILIALLR
jgi:hypothetical protein